MTTSAHSGPAEDTAGAAPGQPVSLPALIASARRLAKADGAAVLDVLDRLLAEGGVPAQQLGAETGISIWWPADAMAASWQPDFAAWSRERAQGARAVVVQRAPGDVRLAVEDPWDDAALQCAAEAVGTWLPSVWVGRRLMDSWLGSPASPLTNPTAQASADVAPVVRFVDTALLGGFRAGASDVHFECDRDGLTVRVRLDGVLTQVARLQGAAQAQQAISRIKVLAALDITERRVPQDGRIRFDAGDAQIDLRASIMPSVHGEDAVLRLLDKAQWRGMSAATLQALAFDDRAAEAVRALAMLPSGMLLVTGPTGSGKTTTVYAALSEINTGLEKIITIEDPVEYELPGVLQIPVNERKGLTFAKGLRSILRHDPDRILVGEIRDAETAEIAVQSALTGHQVFTTVHANGLGDVVGRFRHFGIDMFGLMSALNGIVVQRLLRQLCPHCSEMRPLGGEEARWAKKNGLSAAAAPVSRGCPACRDTGYKGRFVVAEVHRMDDEMRDLVTTGAPLSSLRAHAARQDVHGLLDQALAHVAAGKTSVAEVRRVIGGLA